MLLNKVFFETKLTRNRFENTIFTVGLSYRILLKSVM